jgi:Tol biopolymer transport system component
LQSEDYALYAPDGHLLFERNGALLAQPFDSAKLALSGSPSTIVPSISTSGRSSFTVSQNGILTFHAGLASTGQHLTWFDRNGRKQGEVGGMDYYSNPALSPDGKRLAVGVGDVNAKKRDIWVFDLVRGGSSRLTFDPADDFNPTWSLDGRYIAFSSDRKGKRDLYRKLASGTGDDELLFESPNDSKVPDSWSKDGRYI